MLRTAGTQALHAHTGVSISHRTFLFLGEGVFPQSLSRYFIIRLVVAGRADGVGIGIMLRDVSSLFVY